MALIKRVGPYFLIELLLPGGTLIALCLYLYRRIHLSRVCLANSTVA